MGDGSSGGPTGGRLAPRAFAGSFASSGWTQLALVVSGVLAARMLGAEARGELALLVLLAAAFGLVGTLGLPLALTYEIAQGGRAPKTVLRAVARTAIAQALLFTALHGLTLVVVLREAAPEVRIAGLATLGWTPAFVALQFGLAALQGGLHLDAYNALRALPTTLYAIATLVLWFAGVGTLEAVTTAFVLAYVAAAVVVLAVARSGPSTPVAGRPLDLPSMRRFGLRSLLGWFAPLEAFRLDQAAVGLLVSPAALGLYVVAVAFTNLPRFVGQSIGAVAYPLMARRTERDALGRDVGRVVASGSLVVVALVLVAEVAVGWLVPLLFGAGFENAVPLARLLLPVGGLLAVRRILTDAARGTGLASAGSLAEVVGWAVFGGALLVLEPRYEATGVAMAMLAASAASLAACLWVWLQGGKRSVRAHAEAVSG